MWPLSPLPPPPIPQRIREILKDYPELLDTLQNGLNNVILKPVRLTPPFEVAIWALEDGLESFIFRAKDELDAAEATGDAVAIERARLKERVMQAARSKAGGMRSLRELRQYFEANQRAFE